PGTTTLSLHDALPISGTTFSTRIVRLCSPTPTARNCGACTRADAPGASESERGVTPIRTTSPFGRESISSTVADTAAVSPTLTRSEEHTSELQSPCNL